MSRLEQTRASCQVASRDQTVPFDSVLGNEPREAAILQLRDHEVQELDACFISCHVYIFPWGPRDVNGNSRVMFTSI